MDEERWARSPLLPDFYEVSTHGRARSVDHWREYVVYGKHVRAFAKGRILKGSVSDTYRLIVFYKDKKFIGVSVHRAVATAFIPNPKGYPQVNHRNGNKLDNRIENLEWCTVAMNHRHAWYTGLSKPYPRNGARNPKAKLTDADVLDIRRLAPNTAYPVLAARHGVCVTTIQHVVSRRTWQHL